MYIEMLSGAHNLNTLAGYHAVCCEQLCCRVNDDVRNNATGVSHPRAIYNVENGASRKLGAVYDTSMGCWQCEYHECMNDCVSTYR